MLAVGHRGLEGLERRRLVEMAQEAENQSRRHPEPGARLVERFADPFDHRPDRDATRRVGLRIEEDLGVADVVGVRADEIRGRQVAEVAALDEHARRGVVHVEEVLEVREAVGGTQFVHRSIRQPHAVAFGEREGQLRLKRALDVQVQFRLGKRGDEGLKVFHCGFCTSSSPGAK